MNPLALRYVGFLLAAVVAGVGGGYLAVNQKVSPPSVTQSGTVPAQPFPGQGIPAIPAIPGKSDAEESRITVLTPNGGEVFFSRVSSAKGGDLILWSGNTKRGVKIALLREDATLNADPSPFIVGWIYAGTIAENIFPWGNRGIWDENFTHTKDIPGGKYKILVAADDGKGKFELWNHSTNKPGNFDLSDRAFTIAPRPRLKVITPNGGEMFKIGDTVPIRFEAIDMGDWNWLPIAVVIKRAPDPYYENRGILQYVWVDPETATYEYNWKISSDILPSNDYYVLVDDTGFWNLASLPDQDMSDGLFSIVAP